MTYELPSINDLLNYEEGKHLEFKENALSLEKILKTVVAFCNTAGGKIVLGIEDKTKKIVGIQDVLKVEERIANSIADRICPSITPNLMICSHGKGRGQKSLIIIEVSWSPGVYLKEAGKQAGTYIRQGSTNRKADVATIQSIERYKDNRHFDEMPCIHAKITDLDFNLGKEFLQPRIWNEETAESLKLISNRHPTNAGILLIGKEGAREKFFPSAVVKCGRFKGSNKSDIIDQTVIRLPLPSTVEEVLKFVHRNTAEAIEIKSLKHSKRREYPEDAVREAIINAIIHADYSVKGSNIEVCIFDDRLEITSPGFLPLGLSLEAALKGRSRLRNPTLGQFFQMMKFIEGWGSGLQRIIESCQTYGLQKPEFQEEADFFCVRIFNRSLHLEERMQRKLNRLPKLEKGVSAAEIEDWPGKIVKYLSVHKSISRKEAAILWQVTVKTTSVRLKKLCARGVLKEISKNLYDPSKEFVLYNDSVLKLFKGG